MPKFSVVIVCRNEAAVIGKTLQSLEGLTEDIIVYDNGSTDDTVSVIKKFPVHLHQGSWEGFGKTKRKANELAKYHWILSLDADESVDEQLKHSLIQLELENDMIVYDIPFRNFLGTKYLKHGEWGSDHHIRLFNRQKVNWDDAPVHENLVMPEGISIKKIKGYVLHQTVKNMDDYGKKMVHYAMLNAEKYYKQGRKASWFRVRLSPAFTFFNYYILKLGFLDGHAGFVCAKMTAWYTFMKYARLRELNKG